MLGHVPGRDIASDQPTRVSRAVRPGARTSSPLGPIVCERPLQVVSGVSPRPPCPQGSAGWRHRAPPVQPCQWTVLCRCLRRRHSRAAQKIVRRPGSRWCPPTSRSSRGAVPSMAPGWAQSGSPTGRWSPHFGARRGVTIVRQSFLIDYTIRPPWLPVTSARHGSSRGGSVDGLGAAACPSRASRLPFM